MRFERKGHKCGHGSLLVRVRRKVQVFRETIVESRYSLRAYVARKQRDARDGHDGEAPKLARRAITITIHYLVSQSPGHNGYEHPDL